MSDPLTGDKDRQFDMEFEFDHLKRAGMFVSEHVADEAAILRAFFGPFAIGDPGGLHDRFVGPHVVDEADEAVFADWVQLLLEQAQLTERGSLDDPAGFIARMNRLVG